MPTTATAVVCQGCNQLICPHCGAPDAIEMEASVLVSHRTRYVDGTLTILPAEIFWDAYEFSENTCRICGGSVAIPDGLEVDDQS